MVLAWIKLSAATPSEPIRGLMAGFAFGYVYPVLQALVVTRLVRPQLATLVLGVVFLPPVAAIAVFFLFRPLTAGFAFGAFTSWFLATALSGLFSVEGEK